MASKHLWVSLFFLSVAAAPLTGSIIGKKPSGKPADIKYKDLVCTEEDQMAIHEIISTMAEKGKISLLFQKDHLERRGEQIEHVHPFKFLAFIFKTPYLKNCMYYIWDDYFKRNGFLNGLESSIKKEEKRERIHPYLKDFSEDVGAPLDVLKMYVEAHDWGNLVLFLIQL